MADKTLNDVVDSLKSVEDTIKNPPKSAADKEAATEADRVATEERGIFQGIYDTLQKGFGAATTADKKQGGLIAGLLGGIGSGLGGIGKAVAGIGKGFGIGLAALGAGIAGFVLALGAASLILEKMNPDSSVLTGVITNFFNAFNEENTAKMGVILVIAGLLAGFKVKPLTFAGMMTAMGAGIAGFAGGILIGEVVAGYGLKIMAGLDGTALTGLLNNFFGAMTAETAAGVGILVTMAGLLAGFKIKGHDMALMMTGIGAGIAGFAGGILIGTALAQYGLAAMAALDTTALTSLLQGFFTAMTPEIAVGLGVLVTLAGIATRLKIADIKGATGIALGMTGIGAGIAGFSLGILLGEGAAKLGAMAGLDGGSLATLMTNFMGAFDGVGLVALGALITAGAALGTSGIGAAGVVVGMTAIGAGIAAFMGALVVADWIASLGGDNVGGSLATLLANIGKAIGGFIGGIGAGAIKQLEGFDADKLTQLGQGIKDIGVGMLAFAGGQAAGVVGGVMESVAGFFGQDSPLEKVAELSKDKDINVPRLQELGLGIRSLAEGMSMFAKVDSGAMATNATSLAAVVSATKGEDTEGFFSKITSSVKSMVNQGGTATGDSSGGYEQFVEMQEAFWKDERFSLGERRKIREFIKTSSDPKYFRDEFITGSPLMDMFTFKSSSGREMQKKAFIKSLNEAIGSAATGGLITPKTAGIFQLHQGEMVLDNKAVAAFTKSLDMVNTSQSNALAGMGGGTPIIVNNNNVDNSVQSSQTTAVSMPAPTRSNESTLRALQNN